MLRHQTGGGGGGWTASLHCRPHQPLPLKHQLPSPTMPMVHVLGWCSMHVAQPCGSSWHQATRSEDERDGHGHPRSTGNGLRQQPPRRVHKSNCYQCKHHLKCWHTAMQHHKGPGGKGRCALRSCTREFKPTAHMPSAELAVFARLTSAWFHAPARQPPSAGLWRWGALVVPSLQHH